MREALALDVGHSVSSGSQDSRPRPPFLGKQELRYGESRPVLEEPSSDIVHEPRPSGTVLLRRLKWPDYSQKVGILPSSGTCTLSIIMLAKKGNRPNETRTHISIWGCSPS